MLSRIRFDSIQSTLTVQEYTEVLVIAASYFMTVLPLLFRYKNNYVLYKLLLFIYFSLVN